MSRWFLLMYLFVLALYDWREQKIPLTIVGGGMAAALAVNLYRILHDPADWKWLLVSAVLGTLPGIYMLTAAHFTRKAGYGDGITLISLGMLTNYKICILVWGFSMIFISVVSMTLLFLRKADKNTKLPYIPFLTAAYVLEMMT